MVRNETRTGNHWIGRGLIGHKSNRDGAGAEVNLVRGCNAQWATAWTAGSYLSWSDKRLHFRLGAATQVEAAQVDSLEIHWPSGIKQIVKCAGVDKFMTIDELGALAVTESSR